MKRSLAPCEAKIGRLIGNVTMKSKLRLKIEVDKNSGRQCLAGNYHRGEDNFDEVIEPVHNRHGIKRGQIPNIVIPKRQRA